MSPENSKKIMTMNDTPQNNSTSIRVFINDDNKKHMELISSTKSQLKNIETKNK